MRQDLPFPIALSVSAPKSSGWTYKEGRDSNSNTDGHCRSHDYCLSFEVSSDAKRFSDKARMLKVVVQKIQISISSSASPEVVDIFDGPSVPQNGMAQSFIVEARHKFLTFSLQKVTIPEATHIKDDLRTATSR